MALATARWARTLLCVKDEIIPELPDPAWLAGAGIQPSEFDDWLSCVKMRYTIACGELRIAA